LSQLIVHRVLETLADVALHARRAAQRLQGARQTAAGWLQMLTPMSACDCCAR